MDKLLCSGEREGGAEFGNVAEVEKGIFTDKIDVVVKSKLGIKFYPQVSNGGADRNAVAGEGYGGNGGRVELVGGANLNGFSF